MAVHTDTNTNFTITRLTNGKLPSLPFARIKNAILGNTYKLSLVFSDRKLATQLHKDWKNKDSPANILSFPIDENEGEIFISLETARREAKNFDHSYHQHLTYLFIHGVLHLAGYNHGDEMERLEENYMKNFLLDFKEY